MDRITPEHRSWNMSRIRSTDTSPEKTVRRILHYLGYRFRLHCKNLPGRPDIVLPRYRTVIFVHGCFWHRHKDCKYAYTPKSRVNFWRQKFDKNVEHDKMVIKSLRKQNWNVLIIWECEVSDKELVTNKLKKFLVT